jgi:dienelactone hydrolase
VNTLRTTAKNLVRLLAVLGLVGRSWAANLEVAAFSCDVTPPVGHPLCGGWIKPLEAVDEPLLAKGIVLSDGHTRYVLCAVDWCLLQTGAYDLFRQKLAAAVGIPASQVAVQTVHQHNAPIADVNAQLLLNSAEPAPLHLDLDFMRASVDRLALAAHAALSHLHPFTHVGFARQRVERFASNRRVRLNDGQIHARYSSTTDPALQAAPEGLIDPWLRSVTLFDGAQPLVRLHYYASHPQSYYGDGRATSDTVGLARQRVEREEGIPQIYFTGCAGNITAGKYNDGSPAARAELTDRIYAAMTNAIAQTGRIPVTSLNWRTSRVSLPPRSEPEWQPERLSLIMANTNATAASRLEAALSLAWSERLRLRPELDISRLKLGPVNLLNLPGEAFVEYQLYAQNLLPGEFVAVAAYGEGGPGYICTDAALNEGGYEPTDSRVGAPSEQRLKSAMAALLEPRPNLPGPPMYEDKLHLLTWRDRTGAEHPVRNSGDWGRRRSHVLKNLELVTGPLPPASHRVPLNLRVLNSELLPGFYRKQILFDTEVGDSVPAVLLVPSELRGRAPAMLCLHQTIASGKAEPAGLDGSTNLHYAQELAARGYVTLAPDYPGFGEYRADPYALGYVSATMKGIWNHQRAVDMLESLPEVNRHRIGVIGHSLGGHNALFLAAFDSRLKAVVTSCGFNSFFAYAGGDLGGWSHRGYMPLIASRYGKDPKLMPFDFTELLATIAPRPVFINAPVEDANFPMTGVMDCVAAATPVYRLLHAPDNLRAIYPPGGHDFPPAVREQAYLWLDQVLKRP